MNKLYKLSSLKTPLKRLALLALGAFFVFQSSQIQRYFLRNKAGTQTYMITNEEGNSGGTGFSVKAPSGKIYTLTNAHVCGLAVNDTVFASSALMGNRRVPLHIIEQSKVTDLCLLTAIEGKPGLEIASSVDLGEEINVVGHPALMPITLSRGELMGYTKIEVVVAQNACAKDEGMYKTVQGMFGDDMCVEIVNAALTSAPAFGGNSGSAVLNYKGQVIGVLFAGDNRINWGIIIPLDQVKDFLKVY